jgi:cytochrome c1
MENDNKQKKIYINVIYGSNLIGFAVLMFFTFMSILILLAANHNDL